MSTIHSKKQSSNHNKQQNKQQNKIRNSKVHKMRNAPIKDMSNSTGLRGHIITPYKNVYQGEKNDHGQPHGYGIMSYNDKGDIYKGLWVNGLRQGKGVYYSYTGDKYVGNWNKDIPKGIGMLKLEPSNEIITGSFHSNGTKYYKRSARLMGYQPENRYAKGLPNYKSRKLDPELDKSTSTLYKNKNIRLTPNTLDYYNLWTEIGDIIFYTICITLIMYIIHSMYNILHLLCSWIFTSH